MIPVGCYYSVNETGSGQLKYNNDNTNLNEDWSNGSVRRAVCKLNESPASNASSTTASQEQGQTTASQGQGQTTASQGQGQTTASQGQCNLPACSSFENITNARTLCNEQSHCIFNDDNNTCNLKCSSSNK